MSERAMRRHATSPPARADARDRRGSASPTRLLAYCCILAVPFLLVIASYRGLTEAVDTFHGEDETSGHHPLILELDRELPAVDLTDDWVDGWVATPPLFHFLMLGAGRVVGLELYKLRLLNAAVSYVAVLLLFRLLYRHLGLSAEKSFLFSLVFCLSPYFFGASFLLLTDNLGILFMLLSLILMREYAEWRSVAHFLLACLAIAAACLTRQIYVFLAAVALYHLLTTERTGGRTLGLAACVALALLPLGGFMVLWMGPTPPDQYEAHVAQTIPNLKAPAFGLALLGLYAALLDPRGTLASFNLLGERRREMLGPIALALTVLALHPVRRDVHDDGVLWRVSAYAPDVAASSALFWILTPLGVLVIARYVLLHGVRSFGAVYFVAFLAVMLASELLFQKYFDPFVLLMAFVVAGRGASWPRLEALGIAVLLVTSMAYFFLRPGMPIVGAG